jgi:hypothetical protein
LGNALEKAALRKGCPEKGHALQKGLKSWQDVYSFVQSFTSSRASKDEQKMHWMNQVGKVSTQNHVEKYNTALLKNTIENAPLFQ